MKKFLTSLHRWLGFPLGLLFVVTFGTGCLTAVGELLQRVDHARENSQYLYHPTTLAEDAQALIMIVEGKKGIRQVVLPSPDTPYYRVEARGESWTYAIDQLDREVYEQSNNEGFFRTVLQLHRNYLVGREGLWGIEGKYYAAWVGLIAMLLSLLGLWLWWPLRKTFDAKEILPRGRKRKHFYYSHMSGGVVVLIVILLLALTGASITYRTITQQLLGVQRDKSPAKQAVILENHWQAWLEAAYTQMPEGAHLQQIRFPRQPKPGSERRQRSENNERPAQNASQTEPARNIDTPQLLEFRFHAPGDWLGLAGSTVKIDKQRATLVDISLFSDLPIGEKIYAILKPLHTGHHLPALYLVVLLMLSLLGTVMVFSGLVSFVTKKRKRQKTSRWLNPEPAVES